MIHPDPPPGRFEFADDVVQMAIDEPERAGQMILKMSAEIVRFEEAIALVIEGLRGCTLRRPEIWHETDADSYVEALFRCALDGEGL